MVGVVILSGIIAGMIFTGLIPAPEYQKYVGILLGAFFYHVIRMLNGPTVTNPTQPVAKE